MKIKRIIKIVLLAIFIPIGLFAITFGIYLIYMQANYYRIEDNSPVDIKNNSSTKVTTATEYTIMTYNIGFGAYSNDYSFFMDSGVMKTGKKVTGKYGKGISYDEVLKNTNGDISILKKYNPDFAFLQEVDTDGDRSYHINQYQMITDEMNMASSYAINYHCAFIALPINDPMGKATSGILTLSKYEMSTSTRVQLPLSNGFITKFTDLDRCINVMEYNVSGSDKNLVMINVHLSAYDKGGVVRKQQVALLNSILEENKTKGNYVIVGGDFNHDIAHTLGKFPTTQEDPSWVSIFNEEDLASGYSFAADGQTWGSCRAAEMPYVEGENYVVTVDGFIVSDNITVKEVLNHYENHRFEYSDHLPVTMKFELNA